MRLRLLLLSFTLWLPGLLCGQSLEEFQKKVTTFSLPNGMQFIIIERHDAPVVSFHTYVNAGSVDDPTGATGLAHMFEHMAFKGTSAIGTKDWAKEKVALDSIEKAFDRLDAEKNKGFRADAAKVASLEAQVKGAIATADSYVESNEYDRIVESNGGVNENASTGEDATQYFYSFPSNRLELWFLLESERFLHPVLREFYKERDVVREERRMRVESSPQGMLIEALLASAFEAHPYHNFAGGWASDIESLRRPEAEAFFKKYYVPGNLVISIAGDVDPKTAKAMALRYFGRISSGPNPPVVHTIEPAQVGEKRVKVASPAQPLMVIGYKRPDQYSPDSPALDVLSELLSSGRTGILYKDLIRDQQIALAAETIATFPGGKYPSMFIFFLVPSGGHTVDDDEKAANAIIQRMKTQPVDAASLARVKTKLRAGLISSLDSNTGLAETLSSYQALYGDWKKVFTELDEYNKVTAEDVMRVAKKYFVDTSRTVAWTYAPAPEGAPTSKGESK